MEEGSTGMIGIGLIGLVGIGAIVYTGDSTKVTEVITFGTAIAGMIAALVRGGVWGGGSSNGG